MTVAEILEQAKALSADERKELAKLLIDTLDVVEEPKPAEPASQAKTGAEIVAMLEEMGPIELMYPEIEDPVEWVKKIRQDQKEKRGLDWGDTE